MPESDAPFRIVEEQEVALLEVAGWTPLGLAAIFDQAGRPLPAEPGGAVRHGEALIVRLTPSIAWIIDDAADIPTDGQGCACDLSHSRVRLTLIGAQATALLTRVVALDLDPTAWPIGKASATGIHGVPVVIHRAGMERFEIITPRSFADSIREWIEDAAAEFKHPVIRSPC
ncbi:MAG: Sarcosine oxidase gamma subunit [Xanthobacteraceae bacterium]|jgi:sarcosine oxidase subunit gamma|nr:Sarcosine oxidase gamma subunit [Xanthobacteraceae bacterium]